MNQPIVQQLIPTTARERIESLDILRGFALLGILMVNIQSFSMIDTAYNNPTAFGDWTGMNFAVWLQTYVFFDSKMMAIFSMLFGAGIILMTNRADLSGKRPVWIHLRRMFWLLVFGLAHAHLIWHGDILFTYAICGVIVYWCRNLKPLLLTVVGILLLLVPVVIMIGLGLLVQYGPAEFQTEMRAEWQPSAEIAELQNAEYRKSWLEQLPSRSKTAIVMETLVFAILFFWRAAGLMLIGMAMYKVGILSAQRTNRWYAWTAAITFLVGFTLVSSGVWLNISQEYRFEYSMFFGILPNYFGSVFVAFGYVCLIAMFAKCSCLPGIKRAFQAVGQMALTNYLLQSLIATAIFYGHGLGLFGHVSRTGQFGIVLGIWLLQLIWSPIWLSRFRFGPGEWLWRTLVYGSLQPMSRHIERKV